MLVLNQVYNKLKKKKRDTFSLVLLIFLATMLLVSAVAVRFTISDFYFQSNERLNAPHYTVSIPNNRYQEKYLEYLTNDSRVNQTDLVECAAMYGASYEVNGGEAFIYAYFFSTETESEILPFSLVEQAGQNPENGIYVPYFFKNNGYNLGDMVSFDYNGMVYQYEIAGYFETTWFGSSVNNMVFFYLPGAAYQQLYSEIGGGKLLSARLNDLDELKQLRTDFKQQTGLVAEAAGRNVSCFDTDYFEMMSVSVIMPNIATMIMLAFAMIIFLIVFLVMRFRIYSYIEDHMKNIGVMEAIGYTRKQIRGILAAEYAVITLMGGVAGILAAYPLIRNIGQFVSGFMGVKWVMGNYLIINIISLLLIMLLVVLITMLCSRRILTLTPVAALRGGMGNHNFRKNYFPLGKASSSVQFQLAWKGIMANFRQYLMVGIILAAVSAAVSYTCLLYYNMSGKDSAIYKTLGMESAQVTVGVAKHQDLEAIRAQLLAREEVRKTSMYITSSCLIDDYNVSVNISDDFEQLEMVQVYEGSFPRHDNEIVISGTLSKAINKKIGDLVNVTNNGVTAEYLISGYTQTLNNLGITGILSLDGIRRIVPSFEPNEFNLYLHPGFKTDQFIEQLEQDYQVLSPSEQADINMMSSEERMKYQADQKISKLLTMYGVDSADYSLSVNGEVVFSGSSSSFQLQQIDNLELFIETNLGSFIAMVGALVLIIMIATLFIITLILYLVIRYMLLKRRQEFGVLKAMGYTSKQLRMQIALGFMPVCAAGILSGCLIARISLNAVWNMLLAPVGVCRLEFSGNMMLMAALAAGLLLFVFILSYLLSAKIKQITAYELFTE